MYKSINKIKFIQRYMEALALHTGAPTINWEDNPSCIYVVEDKTVIHTVKHIDIPVWFLQERFGNGLFIPKYEKSSVIPEDMCTKPCSVPIISRITKWTTGFRFYPTSDIEHNQLMRLYEFVVN